MPSYFWRVKMPKQKIDDFFVINDANQINFDKVIETYNRFKNASISESDLKKYFRALLLDTENNMMFKKKEITNNPLQEFWALRFIDIAESNYDNLLINKYSSFDQNDINNIIKLCLGDKIINNIKNYLLNKGIYLYYVKHLPGANIDGAVYMTSFSTIAIGLSIKYERADYVLFTLLHELAHIIKHYDYISEGIISIENSQEEQEMEANRYARDSIIDPKLYRVCSPKRTRDLNDLLRFSKANCIPPVLLAGIIRRDLNNYEIFKDIINNSKIKRSEFYE